MCNASTSLKCSISMKRSHANKSPEEKKRISKNISAGVKKWHAEMSAEKKKSRGRKISKSLQKRLSQIPPRMQKDINKIKSESFRRFDKSPAGREQRKYLGYLSAQDILNCPLDRKTRIIAKRVKGLKKTWGALTPEQKRDRINRTLKKGRIKQQTNKVLFFEIDVPRIKNYCGVVTKQEMEQMHV